MALINGNNSANTLAGTGASDTINGKGGNDTINAKGGNDTIDGGLGTDTINAGAGNDTIYAEDEKGFGDVIMPGLGTNVIIGEAVWHGSSRDGHDLSFRDIQSGVTASLVTGKATASGMSTTFSEVHFLNGSGFADRLTGGNATFDTFEGFVGFAGNDTINGGSGYDAVDYGAETSIGYLNASNDEVLGTQGVVVNLVTGTATDSYGNTDSLSGIEEVRGTKFGDQITAGAGYNRLYGYNGDDTLNGGDGADDLYGGSGDDSISGGNGSDYVVAGSGDDTIIAVDSSSDAFGDYILAGLGTNVVNGSDVFTPGGVRDGHDLSFEDIQKGVRANLSTGIATSTGMSTTFTGVHFLVGSGAGDRLTGGNATFDGFEGFTGLRGNDTIDGGTGIDRVSYAREVSHGYINAYGAQVRGTKGVAVDLKTGTATDAYGTTDTLVSIEWAQGTSLKDKLYGSDGDNQLIGMDGDDALSARGGSDEVMGGGGNDSIAMDAGNDVIDGGTGTDRVTVSGSTAATINLSLTTAQNTGFGSDRIQNVENVIGGSGADTFTGSNGHNLIEGRAGNDTIYGGLGKDTLVGGEGKDLIYGGNDTVRDAFSFRTLAEVGKASKADQVFNFDNGVDDLDFAKIDAKSGTSANDTFVFGGTKATAYGIWTSKSGSDLIVNADVTGDKTADFQVVLKGVSSISVTDLIL